MVKLKSVKYLITEAVVNELKESIYCHSTDIEKIIPQWWTTGRQEGLRLTDMGDFNFRLAKIEFYQFDLQSDIKRNNSTSIEWNIFLMDCNKKIKCPYYLGAEKTKDIKTPFIRVYDNKIAMLIQLYGSVTDYLKYTVLSSTK